MVVDGLCAFDLRKGEGPKLQNSGSLRASSALILKFNCDTEFKVITQKFIQVLPYTRTSP